MDDPVEARASDSTDLYDIASWEPRTALDNVAVGMYRGGLRIARWTLYILGLAIFFAILSLGAGAIILDNPFVLGLVLLSVVPAGLLALYVYVTDVTTSEPATLVAATFILAILFAGFAAVVNSSLSGLQRVPIVGIVLYFYLVVGPGEEFVKLLAVRLYAYTDSRFGTVIDGAVYGAAAGLGFATIENALFILRSVDPIELSAGLAAVAAGDGIAGVRALAGPGHVIYSAFAGYYLGLAKFNPGSRGPIVIKGLIVAAFIHGLYNSTVGVATGAVTALTPLTFFPAFVLFVLAFQGTFGWLLFRKLQRYRRCYRDLHGGPDDPDPELAEFDP